MFWNLCGGVVAAAIFLAFIRQGWTRFEYFTDRSIDRVEAVAWLSGLVLFSFAWLWIVQEVSPVQSRLGKSPFVLYYASSSGYFTRARYQEPDASRFLQGYEALMAEGDVLHTGTHPPGLFLVFHGLISACEKSPELATFLDATQPFSFREALDVIAANALRRQVPRPLLQLDRRILWLATLLVMLSASLAVIPLYGLLRRNVSPQVAWVSAALWPAIPAVAIFVPKSDVAFALPGLCIVWLWLKAWDRRSLALAATAGLVTWLGLFCSLAFLPVVLLTAVLTVMSVCRSALPSQETLDQIPAVRLDLRRGLCVVAAGLAFFLPVLLLWHHAGINLLRVWQLNYANHAGFYQQFPRTYWMWLLINPLELMYAAGWPVALLAFTTICKSLLRPNDGAPSNRGQWEVCISIVAVWGLLWVTGKNSGEAARLWVLFLPWLVWLASFQMEGFATAPPDSTRSYLLRHWQIMLILVAQFVVGLMTVSHASGFHNNSGNAG